MRKDSDLSSCPQLLQDSIRFQRPNISQLLSLMTPSDAIKNQAALKLLELEVTFLLVAAKLSTSLTLSQKLYLKPSLTACYLLWTEIHFLVGVLMSTFSLQDKSPSDLSRPDKIEALINKQINLYPVKFSIFFVSLGFWGFGVLQCLLERDLW